MDRGAIGSSTRTTSRSDANSSDSTWLDAAGAILIGCAATLVVHGYQFGHSNHSVYLIDALRKSDPSLLANDWFTTQTLQYHSVFGWMTAGLIELGVLQTGFAAIYGALVIGLHVAWRSIARSLGGDDRAYLLSVILYYASAGGIGLGTYQFLQDSSVLASNIANVAMLCGVAAWLRGWWIAAGIALGLSGLFHLNHAIVACLFWAVSAVWVYGRSRAWLARRFVAASMVVAVGCLANIAPAALAKLGQIGSMPFEQWLDIYVRLRHPHHYDPSSWPWAQWLAFAIWLPFLWALGGTDRAAGLNVGRYGRATCVLCFFLVLQVMALVFGGVWYVSETLVQMSLYRFSIIPHLMLVTLAGVVLTRYRAVPWALPALLGLAVGVTMLSPMAEVARQRAGSIAAVIALALAPAVLPLIRWRGIVLATGVVAIALVLGLWSGVAGLTMPLVRPDADYLAACEWVERNTPRDAVFLVPPDDEHFRWRARRAIVVNWKSPPQLSSELPEWHDRLAAALGWEHLDRLPRGSYVAAVRSIRARYDEVPADALFAAAGRYEADYVLATRDLGEAQAPRRVGPAFGRYLLYETRR